MRTLSRFTLGLLVAFALLPTSAEGQEETPAPAAACFPECRPGFGCEAGSCVSLCSGGCASNEVCSPTATCVSRCNPLCEPGLVCGEDGLCASAPAPASVPAATPAAPGAAAAPSPTQSGYYVPVGYETQPVAAPMIASPESEAIDLERARKQSLRDQWRPTLNLGFGVMARRFGVDAFGYGIYSPGWGLSVGYGWRYHFARFGSFQVRGLFSIGKYFDDYLGTFGGEEGLQLALNLQATIRFVGYPFFIGAGPSLGFISQIDRSTEGSFGGVIEVGVVFGRDEQFEICTQGMITTGIFSAFLLYSFSYGEASVPTP